jgi:hypothetical protein
MDHRELCNRPGTARLVSDDLLDRILGRTGEKQAQDPPAPKKINLIHMYQAGHAFGQLIVFLIFLTPLIFFLLTQQNTLKVIRRDNRILHPGLVWLQLIPIFNFYWIFVVVSRIADSITKEKMSLEDDSILGVPDPNAEGTTGKGPTYKIGMAWCALYLSFPVGIVLVNLFVKSGADSPAFDLGLGVVSLTLWLAITICWIIYWVKLAKEKRKLQYLQA